MTCSIQLGERGKDERARQEKNQSIQTDIAYIGDHGTDNIQSELEFGRRLAWIKQRTAWLVAAVQQEGSDVLRQVYQDLGDIVSDWDSGDTVDTNGSDSYQAGKANSV